MPRALSAAGLLAIAALAFWLRYDGITFGFPIIVHPDEPQLGNPAIYILRTGELHPLSFLYPSLCIYLHTLVFGAVTALSSAAGRATGVDDVPIATLYYWGRLLTITMSVVTIVATARIGRRLADTSAGLVAAGLVTCSFLHVSNSFTMTTDVPMAMWTLLAFGASARILLGATRTADYALAGVLVGLAGGTKYNAVFALIPLALAHLMREPPSIAHVLDRRFLVGLALVPVAFLLTTPYAVLDYATFADFLGIQRDAYRVGHAGAEATSTSYAPYAAALGAKVGVGALAAASLGVVAMLRSAPKNAILTLAFPVAYFAFMGSYRVHFDRNLVVLVPFIALLAGYAVHAAVETVRRTDGALRAAALTAVVLLSVAIGHTLWRQTRMSLAHTARITLPNTRYTAKLWIEEHLPPGVTIAREHYTPPIDETRFRVTRLEYYGLLRAGNLERFDYLVASSEDFGRFVFHPARYPEEARRYREIFTGHRLVRSFIPDQTTTTGPAIYLYATARAAGEEPAAR